MLVGAQQAASFGLLGLGLLAVSGCARSCHTVIAIVPETTAQEMWESEHAGADQVAREFGWRVYWNAPSREDDVPRQIQIVDQEIDRHVSALVLSPDHALALIAPVRRALVQNIPVVILGSRLGSRLGMPPNARLHLVLNDEQQDGLLAAQRAELYLRPTSTIAVLGVDPNIPGSIERTGAIDREIHSKLPDVRVVERRLTSLDFAEAEEVAEETIDSNPNLSVIISLNINQTRGAYQALSVTHAAGRVRLIGCDQDLDLMNHLRTGGIDSIVAENTFRMGIDAMDILHEIRAGHPVRDEHVQPVLVTRENIDAAPVQQLLSMDWIGR